ALGILVLAGSSADGRYSRLLAFCLAAAIATAAAMVVVASFGGITNRYMVDFVPGFIVLASIGLLASTTFGANRGGRRLVMSAAVMAAFLYSSAFNVLASFRHNELFRVEHPDL